jgi:hypothetical protein
LPDAKDSGERRANRLTFYRGQDLFDARFALPLIRDRPVVFGPRDHPFLQQVLHPAEIDAGQIALRFDRCQLRPLLPGVELHEHLASAHRPPGFEADSIDDAGQVGAHRDALNRCHGADDAQRRRPLFFLRDHGRDGFRGRLEGCTLRHRDLNLLELHESERGDDC